MRSPRFLVQIDWFHCQSSYTKSEQKNVFPQKVVSDRVTTEGVHQLTLLGWPLASGFYIRRTSFQWRPAYRSIRHMYMDGLFIISADQCTSCVILNLSVSSAHVEPLERKLDEYFESHSYNALASMRDAVHCHYLAVCLRYTP